MYKKAVDSYNMSRGNKSKDFESQVNETHFKPQMRRVVLNKNRPQTCIDRHYNSASLMYSQPQNKSNVFKKPKLKAQLKNTFSNNMFIEEITGESLECIGTVKPLDEPIRIEDCVQTYTSLNPRFDRLSSQNLYIRSKFYENNTHFKTKEQTGKYANPSRHLDIRSSLEGSEQIANQQTINLITCEPAVAPPKIQTDTSQLDRFGAEVLLNNLNSNSASQPQLCNEDLNESYTEIISRTVTPNLTAASNACLFKKRKSDCRGIAESPFKRTESSLTKDIAFSTESNCVDNTILIRRHLESRLIEDTGTDSNNKGNVCQLGKLSAYTLTKVKNERLRQATTKQHEIFSFKLDFCRPKANLRENLAKYHSFNA